MTASDELKAVAERLADWVEPAPGVTVYLFGSRVRGDHQPNSDVDVRLYPDELANCEAAMQWWAAQNTSALRNSKRDFPVGLSFTPAQRMTPTVTSSRDEGNPF